MNLNEYAEELIQELENSCTDLGAAITMNQDSSTEEAYMNQASEELYKFVAMLIRNQKKHEPIKITLHKKSAI